MYNCNLQMQKILTFIESLLILKRQNSTRAKAQLLLSSKVIIPACVNCWVVSRPFQRLEIMTLINMNFSLATIYQKEKWKNFYWKTFCPLLRSLTLLAWTQGQILEQNSLKMYFWIMYNQKLESFFIITSIGTIFNEINQKLRWRWHFEILW